MTRPSKRELERDLENLGGGGDGPDRPRTTIVYETPAGYVGTDGRPVATDPACDTLVVLDGEYTDVPDDSGGGAA